MKFLKTIVFVFWVALMNMSCAQTISTSEYTAKSAELESLLKPDRFTGKQIAKNYPITDIVSASDPIYVKLKQAGIINDKSYIMYTAADCISLVTRASLIGETFADYVVMNNMNEGQFACSINDVYTLNQDETVVRLNIIVSKLSALMNLFIVTNK